MSGYNYVLNPGRYVGATEEEEDGVSFPERIASLRTKLALQFQESHLLAAQIEATLGDLEA